MVLNKYIVVAVSYIHSIAFDNIFSHCLISYKKLLKMSKYCKLCNKYVNYLLSFYRLKPDLHCQMKIC